MRKLILILFILLSCASLANSGGIISFPGGGVPSGAAVDYSSIVSFINAEGTWVGTTTANVCTEANDYTLGASECGFDSSIDCDQDVARTTIDIFSSGNYAVANKLDGGNGFFRLEWTGGGAFDKGCFGTWVDPTGTMPANLSTIAVFYDNAPSNKIALRFRTGNKVDLQLLDDTTSELAAGEVESTTTTFHTTTHYATVCYDFSLAAGNDYIELWVDGVKEDEARGEDFTNGFTVRFIYVGNFSVTDPVNQWYWDNFIISSDPTFAEEMYAIATATTKPTGACP